MTINVLGLKTGEQYKYVLGLDNKPSITGIAVCILDWRFDQRTSYKDAWAKIINTGGTNDSITYVVSVVKSSQQSVYVGKTLGTFSKRYPTGPTGGLLKALSPYDPLT